MNTTELREVSSHAQAVAGKGAEALAELRKLVTSQYQEHFVLHDGSKNRLLMSYYGLMLLFRVEMRYREKDQNREFAAFIVGYSFSPENELKQKKHFSWGIDRVGNISSERGAFTATEFPQYALSSVFTELAAGAGVFMVPDVRIELPEQF